MLYATQQDLIDRFGEDELIQLTDRADPPAGAIDAAVAARALDAAEAMIDGYVGVRYALPLAQVPPLLTGIACDLARYHLYTNQATETVSARRDQAVATLRDIAAGKLALPVGETETPAPASVGVAIAGPGRVFSSDSLKGF
jgi:phage gp36-like protein